MTWRYSSLINCTAATQQLVLVRNEKGRELIRERPWERLKRRQDGVLSGRLVSTQCCVLSTGGCGGFIKLLIHSPCTWVTGPHSQSLCKAVQIIRLPALSPIWLPEAKKKKRRGCPPVGRGWREREGKVKDSQDPIRFFVVCGLQLFRAYLFSLADLQMNKVRAVLLPAGCTSKETEGGSGPWVMVSIWPWPPGLGRWRYVVTAPRRPLVAPPFRPRLGKWKRAITLEEVSFHFNS